MLILNYLKLYVFYRLKVRKIRFSEKLKEIMTEKDKMSPPFSRTERKDISVQPFLLTGTGNWLLPFRSLYRHTRKEIMRNTPMLDQIAKFMFILSIVITLAGGV